MARMAPTTKKHMLKKKMGAPAASPKGEAKSSPKGEATKSQKISPKLSPKASPKPSKVELKRERKKAHKQKLKTLDEGTKASPDEIEKLKAEAITLIKEGLAKNLKMKPFVPENWGKKFRLALGAYRKFVTSLSDIFEIVPLSRHRALDNYDIKVKRAVATSSCSKVTANASPKVQAKESPKVQAAKSPKLSPKFSPNISSKIAAEVSPKATPTDDAVKKKGLKKKKKGGK